MGAAPPLARLRLTGLVLAAALGTGGCATGRLVADPWDGLTEPWDDRIVAEGPCVDGERHGWWTLRWPWGLVAQGFYDRGEERGEWYYRYPEGGCKVVTYGYSPREVWIEEQPMGNAVMFGGHVVLEHLEPGCNPPGVWMTSWLESEAKTRAAQAAEEALGLTREQRRRIQESLEAAGFDLAGPADGVFRPYTRMAIARWQRERGYEMTTYLAKGQVLALMGWRWLALMGGGPAREAEKETTEPPRGEADTQGGRQGGDASPLRPGARRRAVRGVGCGPSPRPRASPPDGQRRGERGDRLHGRRRKCPPPAGSIGRRDECRGLLRELER